MTAPNAPSVQPDLMTVIGRALAAAHGYTQAEWDDPENASMRVDHLYDAESVVKEVQPLLDDAYDRGVMAGTDSAYRAGIDVGELWAVEVARGCRTGSAVAQCIGGHRAAWPDRVSWRDEADGERT